MKSTQDPAIVEPPLGLPVQNQTPSGTEQAATDLTRRTTRGALISTGAQVATLALRMGSMMVLARLLLKEDFGLVNMVTALTGFLGLFRDFGLSMATVQRASITDAQTSTLFWVNLAVGVALTVMAAGAAPLLAGFYSEPRLAWITVVLAMSFLFNGAAAQHRAMLQRSMRFKALVGIDVGSLLVSVGCGIGLAAAGFGYWALVIMNVSQPAASLLGTWAATKWVPGRPQRGCGIKSMLWFGGTVTLNSVIVYLAYNIDKVLLGRLCGGEVLGVYGRAYQLINLPTDNLNSTIGLVAFPALSRVQNEPERLRSYFLRGYSLFLSLVVPITMGCALFADDIVRVFLGAKWHEAAPIFRLMAPTIVVFGLVNPLAWLMVAGGHALRSLKIAFMIAPVVVLGYVIGLKYGPHGVAAGFSIAMTLLATPIIMWAKHGTPITNRDILVTLRGPFLSILLAAGIAWALQGMVGRVPLTFVRLVLESSILFGSYILLLFFVFGEKSTYISLLNEIGLLPGSRGRHRKGE